MVRPSFLRPQPYAPKRGIAALAASPQIGHSALPLLRTTLGDTTMARGSKTRNSAVGTPSTLTSLLLPAPTAIPSPLNDPIILAQLHHGNYDDPSLDLRVHHPNRQGRPAPAPFRNANTIVTGRNLIATRFNLPNLVGICVRRRIRREVLFALNRQTRGGGGGKPRHRNRFSKVRC